MTSTKHRFRPDMRIKPLKSGIRIRFERGIGGPVVNQFFYISEFDSPEKLLRLIYSLSRQAWFDRSLLENFLYLSETVFNVPIFE